MVFENAVVGLFCPNGATYIQIYVFNFYLFALNNK